MEHKNLLFNHILESWTFANAAARTGATVAAGDVGRIGYQSDTGQYWRLVGPAPTWQILASPSYAGLSVGVANPTGTNAVAPGKMMGIGSVAKITPTATGKVLVTIEGNMGNSAANISVNLLMAYGTVASGVPTNGAAPAGTQIGSWLINASSIPANCPFSDSALIAGLVVGTQYWFDLQIWTGNVSGTASVINLIAIAAELP